MSTVLKTPIGTGTKAGQLGKAASAAESLIVGHPPPARAFLGIFARIGTDAAADAAALARPLSLTTRPPSAAAVEQAWDAAARLHQHLRSIAGPAHDVAAVELTQAMHGLLARDRQFCLAYTSAIADALKKEQAARLARAVKKGLLPAVKVTDGAHVVAHLQHLLPDMEPGLHALWITFAAEPGAMEGLRLAATYAAQHAPAIVKARRLSGRARAEALSGYRVNVRGYLGEPWALADPAVREVVEQELALASEIAAATAGWTAEVFTQSAHHLRLNNAESVDQLVAIVSRGRRRLIEKTKIQVKIADESEGAAQSVKDVFRGVGWRGLLDPWANPVYTLVRHPGATPEHFLVDIAAKVRPRVVLVNPYGSRIPPRDLEALRSLVDVTEAPLTRPASDLTALADSIVDSAVAAHHAGLLGS